MFYTKSMFPFVFQKEDSLPLHFLRQMSECAKAFPLRVSLIAALAAAHVEISATFQAEALALGITDGIESDF